MFYCVQDLLLQSKIIQSKCPFFISRPPDSKTWRTKGLPEFVEDITK